MQKIFLKLLVFISSTEKTSSMENVETFLDFLLSCYYSVYLVYNALDYTTLSILVIILISQARSKSVEPSQLNPPCRGSVAIYSSFVVIIILLLITSMSLPCSSSAIGEI